MPPNPSKPYSGPVGRKRATKRPAVSKTLAAAFNPLTHTPPPKSEVAASSGYQTRKANKYKSTRSYGQAVQSGTARGDVDAAKRYGPKSKKYKHTAAKLRRGQDQVWFPIYKAYYNRLYQKAGGAYPGLKHRPGVVMSHIPDAGAYVDPNEDRRIVHIDPHTVDEYVAQGVPAELQRYAKFVPLHEWTHVVQKRDLPKWQTEGGAEAFARALAGDLHMKAPAPSDREYARYLALVRSTMPRSFIVRGQFRKKK